MFNLRNKEVKGALHTTTVKILLRDFPGGAVVKNLPYNAGDVGLIPDKGTKVPHAAGQLSPRAANYRAHVPWTLRAATRERKPACHN